MPRAVRRELGAQIDAFVASALPETPRQQWSEPAIGPACGPEELWLGAHLPQLGHPQNDLTGERRRQKMLERLAVDAYRFTPRVSLVPPDGLLLEVKGSLHLFGGWEGLRSSVEASHRSAGTTPVPSPKAGWPRRRRTSASHASSPPWNLPPWPRPIS